MTTPSLKAPAPEAIEKVAKPTPVTVCMGCLRSEPTRTERPTLWTVGHAIVAGLRENA